MKRLGTVLGRRRQSYHPYGRGQSPEKAERSTSNLGSKLPFGGRRDKNKDRDLPSTPEAPPPPSSSRRLSDGRSQIASRMSEAPPSPTQFRGNAERTNGMLSPPAEETEPSNSLTNGSKQPASPELQEPLRPEAATLASLEPPKDAEGFSVPQSGSDAIAQAEREAAEAGTSEQPQPQFKLDIRDAPIREEGVDDEAALASVANSLKMVRFKKHRPARDTLLTRESASSRAPSLRHGAWTTRRSQHHLCAITSNARPFSGAGVAEASDYICP